MIYWTDVKNKLIKHCPERAEAHGWDLKGVVLYLNGVERLSMKRIASLTEGACGRTSLVLKMKELKEQNG